MPGPLVFILPPFQTKAPGISVSASSTATTGALLPVGSAGVQVRIVNEGPNIAFLCFSKNGTLATLPTASTAKTCDAVLSGEDVILTLGVDDNYISAICRATATATLNVYVGYGQ